MVCLQCHSTVKWIYCFLTKRVEWNSQNASTVPLPSFGLRQAVCLLSTWQKKKKKKNHLEMNVRACLERLSWYHYWRWEELLNCNCSPCTSWDAVLYKGWKAVQHHGSFSHLSQLSWLQLPRSHLQQAPSAPISPRRKDRTAAANREPHDSLKLHLLSLLSYVHGGVLPWE